MMMDRWNTGSNPSQNWLFSDAAPRVFSDVTNSTTPVASEKVRKNNNNNSRTTASSAKGATGAQLDSSPAAQISPQRPFVDDLCKGGEIGFNPEALQGHDFFPFWETDEDSASLSLEQHLKATTAAAMSATSTTTPPSSGGVAPSSSTTAATTALAVPTTGNTAAASSQPSSASNRASPMMNLEEEMKRWGSCGGASSDNGGLGERQDTAASTATTMMSYGAASSPFTSLMTPTGADANGGGANCTANLMSMFSTAPRYGGSTDTTPTNPSPVYASSTSPVNGSAPTPSNNNNNKGINIKISKLNTTAQHSTPTPTPAEFFQRGDVQQRSSNSSLNGETSMGSCVLEFKMGRMLRVRWPSDLPLSVGQYVIAKIDSNGIEDAGYCIGLYDSKSLNMVPKHLGGTDLGSIIRVATEEDCAHINDVLPQLEAKALQHCHQMIHFLHLPFVCVDAEYTFDSKQVRVYYSLAPEAHTSNAPNVSRLQREMAFALKAKVLLEPVVQGRA